MRLVPLALELDSFASSFSCCPASTVGQGLDQSPVSFSAAFVGAN